MSKSIFAKAAAIVCGAATLCALSVTASAAVTTFDATKGEGSYALVDGKVNTVAAQITLDEADLANAELDADKTQAGFQVKYPVYIVQKDAEGFGGLGLNLFLAKPESGSALGVVLNADGDPETVKNEDGDVEGDIAKGGFPSFVYNDAATNPKNQKSEVLVGCSCMRSSTYSKSGKWVEFLFTIPEGAKAGDQWDISAVVNKMNDKDSQPIAAEKYNEVNGWIKINGAAATTEAPVVTTLAPVADTTLAPADVTTAAPADATTEAAGSGVTTATEATQGTGTGTTASGKGAGKDSNSGKSGTSTDAAKTGDAGVGVAAAALLLAAGTAVVATRKKKD